MRFYVIENLNGTSPRKRHHLIAATRRERLRRVVAGHAARVGLTPDQFIKDIKSVAPTAYDLVRRRAGRNPVLRAVRMLWKRRSQM